MMMIIIVLFIISTNLTAQNYFPLEVGNSWTYCSSFDTINKRTYLVKDTITFDSEKYFIYGRENNLYNDTLFADNSGNVWKLHNGISLKWLNFLTENDSIYKYPFTNEHIYEVSVKKNLSVKTYVDTFDECINFYFNVPELIDDEISYTFAPEIGIIKTIGAKVDELLYSVVINNAPVKVNISKVKVSEFVLKQNYPNPFNPITTINYSIPTKSYVTLKIFNVLGKEIKTLINENKPAGNYSVVFDANSLSSGVYFYRIQSEDFIETKKLLLQK